MGPFGTMKWTDGRCYEGQFRDGSAGMFDL